MKFEVKNVESMLYKEKYIYVGEISTLTPQSKKKCMYKRKINYRTALSGEMYVK